MDGVPLSDILTLTRTIIIKFSAWEFNLNAHPYTVGRIAEHLREKEGWVNTPELRNLLDSGKLVEARARKVVYSVGAKPSIKFPARDLTVRFMGKCARHRDELSIIVCDLNEAAYLCKTLGSTDRLLNFEKANDVHHIQYRGEKVQAQ